MLELKLDTEDEEEEVFLRSIALLLCRGGAFTIDSLFPAP